MLRTANVLSTALVTTALVLTGSVTAVASPPTAASTPSALLRGELVVVADVERAGPDEHEDHDHGHDADALRAHLEVDGLAVPVDPAAVEGLTPGSTVTLQVPVPDEVVQAIDAGAAVPVAADAVTDATTQTATIPVADLTAASAVPAPEGSDIAAATAVAAATSASETPVAAQVVGTTAPPAEAPSGAHSVTVAVVGFADAPATYSDADVDRVLGAASDFWSEQSGGALTFPRVGAVTRYTTSVSCSDYNALFSEGTSRTGFARTAGRHLLLLLPPAGYQRKGCSYGLGSIGYGAGSGGLTYVSDASWTAVAHELGHNLSLMHANALKCGTPARDAVQSGGSLAGCSELEYGDSTNVMSGSTGDTTGNLGVIGLAALGLLDGDGSRTLTASGTTAVVLAPLSARAGLRSAVVTDPRNGNTYYLENRQPAGRDTYGWSGSSSGGVTFGVRVLKRGASGSSVLLDPTPGAQQSTWYSREDVDRAVAAGTTWTSIGGGVQLRTSAPDASTGAVTVRVSLATSGEQHWVAAVGPTTLTTDAVTSPARVGAPFTLTGTALTVAGTPAPGQVTATTGSTTLATTTAGGDGRFVLTWTPAAEGTTTVVLTQSAVAGQHTGGTASLPFTVQGAGATTTSADPVTAPVGSTATLQVRVTSPDAPTASVAGTVTATTGGAQVATGPVVQGAAALALSALPVGSHTVSLAFTPATAAAGAVQLTASTGTATVTVTALAPSLLTTNALSASPRTGSALTLTGTALTSTGAPASGQVTATAAGTVVTQAAAGSDGRFALTWTPSSSGTVEVVLTQAAVAGRHAGGSTSLTLVVQGAGATSTTAAPVTAQVGAAVALQVRVTSADAPAAGPAGTVVASLDGVQLAKGSVSRGASTLRLSKLPVGTHAVSLVFTPSAPARGALQLAGSTGTAEVEVTPLAPTTTAKLKTTSVTVAQRAIVTVAVTARGGRPTGTLSVLEGATVLATAPLVSGRASVELPLLPLGDHSLTVTYSGDDAVAASSTAGPVLTVTPKPVSVVTATATKATTATQAVLTVSAKVASKGAVGEVVVSEGGTALGTVTLRGGRGTLKLDRLTAGTHTLTLTHADGELFTGSSGTVDVAVTPSKATVKAALAARTVTAGTGTSVTVVVTSPAGTPTGTVQLLDQGVEIATASLTGGAATLVVPADLAVGSHRLTVTYSGSSEVLTATASAGSLTVRR